MKTDFIVFLNWGEGKGDGDRVLYGKLGGWPSPVFPVSHTKPACMGFFSPIQYGSSLSQMTPTHTLTRCIKTAT